MASPGRQAPDGAPRARPRWGWLFGDLTPNGMAVVGVHTLFVAGVGLSTTFVNVYLWRHGGGIAVVARYHVALFAAFLAGAVLAGHLASRLDRVLALRVGIALHAVFFLSVLLLGTAAARVALPLGALMGFGMGFYYLGCSVLMFDFSPPASAHHLVGAIDQARLAGLTLTPFVAGWAIDRLPSGHGYRAVFAASFLLFLSAVAFSRRVRRSAPEDGRLPLGEALGGPRTGRWRRYLVAQGWRGLRDGVFLFLAGILIFERTRDELVLGLFALGTGALTWISTRWVGVRSGPEHRGLFLTAGTVGTAVAAAGLVLFPGWAGIVVFGLFESLALPFVAVPFSAVSYAITAEDRARGPARIAYMVARELPLNLGRLAGVALLLVAVQWVRHPAALQVTLGALGLANVAAWWILRKGVV